MDSAAGYTPRERYIRANRDTHSAVKAQKYTGGAAQFPPPDWRRPSPVEASHVGASLRQPRGPVSRAFESINLRRCCAETNATGLVNADLFSPTADFVDCARVTTLLAFTRAFGSDLDLVF